MAQSLCKMLVHIVFSTKNRERLIDTAIEPKLHAYMAGILEQMDSPAVLIGGADDHVHSLILLSKNKALTEVIQEMKRGSSKWIKDQGSAYRSFYWQSGYGAFSIGQSSVNDLKVYIQNQREHHLRTSFQDELRLLFRKYEVEFDERYVWD